MTEMTLKDAIAEVKRAYVETLDPIIDTILQAVASGDMIPRTDADLAVALAYQRAAAYSDKRQDHDIAAGILALSDADALAEVEALKAERDELYQLLKTGDHVSPAARLLKRYAKKSDARFTRAEAAEAEVARLTDVLDSIDVYLSDTLSGRVTPDPATYAEWLVDGIRVARTRARDRAWKPAHDARAALTTPEKDDMP